jgi:heat shock protein HslJ
MRRLPLLLLTVATAAILGACSSDATLGTPAQGLDSGRTFLSTDVQGMTLVPGTRVTLTFKDGSLQASGGCNSMGGKYALDGDRLTTSQMFMTEMGCDEPRMKQDAWLSAFLADVKLSLDGDTITLDDGTVRLTLLDQKVATPDQPIEGTLWTLDGIVTGQAVSSVPQGVVSTIRIVDGKLEVNTGCNSGGGDVTVTPDSLTFGPLVLTKKACEAGPASVEGAVTSVLTGTVVYSINADVLVLDPRAAEGLTYRAAP